MSEVCPACQTAVPSEASFCPSCGAPLTADARQAGDDRTLAAITHILALVTWVFGPLIVMLISQDEFVVTNAKNALMWQVMAAVYAFIAMLLVFIVIGIPLLIILGILDLAFCIIAAVKASEGDAWRYPLTPAV